MIPYWYLMRNSTGFASCILLASKFVLVQCNATASDSDAVWFALTKTEIR